LENLNGIQTAKIVYKNKLFALMVRISLYLSGYHLHRG